MSTTLFGRIKTAPLIAKVAIAAVVVLVSYLYAVEPALDGIMRYGGKSASDEAALNEYARSGGKLRSSSEGVALGVRQFGEIALPGDPQSRPSEFNSEVDAVLRKHGVEDVTSTSSTRPMEGKGVLVKYLGTGQKVDRVMKELSFSTTPEAFHAVLADLERTPTVAAISKVQVRQGDDREKADRKLKISLSLETWTVSKKERS